MQVYRSNAARITALAAPVRTRSLEVRLPRIALMVEQTVEYDRFKRIQFQLSTLCCHRDRHIISNDVKCDLVHYFRDDRIHFSRHD